MTWTAARRRSATSVARSMPPPHSVRTCRSARRSGWAACPRAGSAEQLAATLPTAAMVCWQVGALDAARGYVAEAMPLLAGSRRIARVVLLCAAAGLALADGDLGAAIELGTQADGDARDLGIDREIPLIRCVLAQAM